MKANKEATRAGRQLLQLCLVDGEVDEGRAKKVVQRVAEEKPRQYLQILSVFQRLLRLELSNKHAVIESAAELGAAEKKTIEGDLQKQYGANLTTEYEVDEALLGGLRIKVGSDVWDGTVKERLRLLQEAL